MPEDRAVRAHADHRRGRRHVSYLEGCTAPQRDENQLHAAVVELVALEDAFIKYSTVQNWYPGDAEGRGGIYNFVTKRGDCAGRALAHRLDAGRDRLGHHLEISGVVLRGDDDSVGEFHHRRVNHWQQADTGTKMIHLGQYRSTSSQGHQRRPRAETLPRPGARPPAAAEVRATTAVRFAADRARLRRAHFPYVDGAQRRW